jgi:hypothetical protein
MKKGIVTFAVLLSLASFGFEQIEGIKELIRLFQLEPYQNSPLERVTIAVLDRGFAGLVETDGEGNATIKPGLLPPRQKRSSITQSFSVMNAKPTEPKPSLKKMAPKKRPQSKSLCL